MGVKAGLMEEKKETKTTVIVANIAQAELPIERTDTTSPAIKL